MNCSIKQKHAHNSLSGRLFICKKAANYKPVNVNDTVPHTCHLRLQLGPGRGGSRLSRDAQTSLSPDTSSSSSGGSPSVPRPAKRHSPSSISWAVPFTSSWWNVPGTPPEGDFQEASETDVSHLN
ncbi:hypothetical protein XENOCAPTIV_002745 [Xenoophorus captivus]|uniref:Uncharacterized protein n=1 Tax=Xenoophorus captivus TaxID=1517983 RepID=A0ABV0S9W8_9TELE